VEVELVTRVISLSVVTDDLDLAMKAGLRLSGYAAEARRDGIPCTFSDADAEADEDDEEATPP
jgi:hypothetical protein